jgi:hypothetical protein
LIALLSGYNVELRITVAPNGDNWEDVLIEMLLMTIISRFTIKDFIALTRKILTANIR